MEGVEHDVADAALRIPSKFLMLLVPTCLSGASSNRGCNDFILSTLRLLSHSKAKLGVRKAKNRKQLPCACSEEEGTLSSIEAG